MVGSALEVLGLDAASVIRSVTDLQIRVEKQALWAGEPECLSPITFAKRRAVVWVGQHHGPRAAFSWALNFFAAGFGINHQEDSFFSPSAARWELLDGLRPMTRGLWTRPSAPTISAEGMLDIR